MVKKGLSTTAYVYDEEYGRNGGTILKMNDLTKIYFRGWERKKRING